jgi:transcription elongation factor Elf1
MHKNSLFPFTKAIQYPSTFVCAECKKESTIKSAQDHVNLVCLSCSSLYKLAEEERNKRAAISKRSTIFDQPCK